MACNRDIFTLPLPYFGASFTGLPLIYTKSISLLKQPAHQEDTRTSIGTRYRYIHSHLKTELILSDIQKFSSYLTGNILRLHYRNQPVKDVHENIRCLLPELYETHIHILCGELRVLMCYGSGTM
jgi:hypothetical protein